MNDASIIPILFFCFITVLAVIWCFKVLKKTILKVKESLAKSPHEMGSLIKSYFKIMKKRSEGIDRIFKIISILSVVYWICFAGGGRNFLTDLPIKGALFCFFTGIIVAYFIPQIIKQIIYWVIDGFKKDKEITSTEQIISSHPGSSYIGQFVKRKILSNSIKGITGKILLELLVIFISFVVSVLGVSFFWESLFFDYDISIIKRGSIALTVWLIMVSAAQPAIWKKGFLTTSDRIFSFFISSILGLFIYLSLAVLAANLFYSTQFDLGLQVGALSNFIGILSGSIFCNYHLVKTVKWNDAAEKDEKIIISRTISSKCPDCKKEYTNFDYREDAKDWFCSQCKAKLLKI